MQPKITYSASANTDPLKSNFGESGAGVLALQKSLNQKYKDTPGYVPIKEDSLYGPITQAAFMRSKGGNAIVSTNDIHNEARTNSTSLDNALKLFNIGATTEAGGGNVKTNIDESVDITQDSTDPYVKMLNDLSTRSNDSTKMLISNIQAQRMRKQNSIDKEYDNYSRGLQALGIQQNKAQSSPDLLAGQIKEAENQHMEKISALDAEESKALMDAENARADNDFKVLKEKMDYVKEIKKQKADALKELHNTLSDTSKAAEIEAHDIYDTLDTLGDDDKESFLIAVSKKFNLPLGGLVTALNDEKNKREAADLKTRNTKSILDNRGKNPSGNSKEEIAQGKSVLLTGKLPDGTVIGNPKGKDGYYDPYVFKKLFEKWTGTPKEFVAKYPIIGSINPEGFPLLPESLQQFLPKKAIATKNKKLVRPKKPAGT